MNPKRDRPVFALPQEKAASGKCMACTIEDVNQRKARKVVMECQRSQVIDAAVKEKRVREEEATEKKEEVKGKEAQEISEERDAKTEQIGL